MLPENQEALQIFLACGTQWRTGSQGFLGLDYTALISVIKLKHRKRHRELFDDVQLIEQGALRAIRGLRPTHGKRV